MLGSQKGTGTDKVGEPCHRDPKWGVPGHSPKGLSGPPKGKTSQVSSANCLTQDSQFSPDTSVWGLEQGQKGTGKTKGLNPKCCQELFLGRERDLWTQPFSLGKQGVLQGVHRPN